jgi:uncharacterized protein (DUF1684 family)
LRTTTFEEFQMCRRTALILMSLLPLSVAVPVAAASDDGSSGEPAYTAEIEQWRAARVERLQQPEGWLSLVGLHWLSAGAQTVGRAPDSDVVLAVGPERLGTLTLDDGRVRLALLPDVDARIGDSDSREAELIADSAGTPTVVRFGDASFVLIERSGRFGLRVRDPKAPTRTGFTGIEHYPIDPDWRVAARFEPHPEGRTIEIASVINTLEPMANPGSLVFEIAGKEHRLEAIDDGSGQFFIIFADRTNGRETYGPGRFVYTALPVDGLTTLDFNRAYNPPCAFNAYSTCPLPPPENRLDLAVTAGEKKYNGPH